MFGIGYGPSTGETGATNALTGESGFAGSVGEGLLNNSSAFINALMSGNQGDIAKLLAPQIGEIAKSANEKTQTNAEFGSRSGGVNASNQNTMDTARGSVNDLIASLTGSAINSGASLGSNLLGQGMSGYNDVFKQNQVEQQQNQAKWNDIFNSAAAFAAAPFTGGASLSMGSFHMPGSSGSSSGGGSFGIGSGAGPGGFASNPEDFNLGISY